MDELGRADLGEYDLVVVGGGVLGLAHAYVASARGLKVCVVERDARANGASIRNFGFITVTGQARGDMWRLARRTRDIWAAVATECGLEVHQRGLMLSARSDEALTVIEAFLKTEMGEGCSLLSAAEFRAAAAGLGSADLKGALASPHEIRVESRTAIPALAAWLKAERGVSFLYRTAVLEVAAPTVHTTAGRLKAAAVAVCPGDDFTSLYADRIAGYGVRRCRLSMLRLADPGLRLNHTLMSDLSLTRYRGYADLPEARPLDAKLRAEQPRHFENGVHLILAQGEGGELIVGDSHHYGELPTPFAPASAEADILDEYQRALGRPAPEVVERWTGVYAVADDRTFLIDAPEPAVRLVMVTTGAGASTCFGLAERVIGELFDGAPI